MIEVTVAQAQGTREEQEDVAAAIEWGGGVLAVLADGMGGHAHGAEAANAAVDAVLAYARRRRADELVKAIATLDGAINAACDAVFQLRLGHVGYKPPGCTLLVALVRYDQIVLAHVGDSRAWWCADPWPNRPLVQHHAYGNQLLSHIPTRTQTDFVTMTGTPLRGRLVLASGGVEEPSGITAGQIVNNQLGQKRRIQDNATALVVTMGTREVGDRPGVRIIRTSPLPLQGPIP